MKVESVTLVGAATFGSLAAIALPPRGLVLISGENGAGKSTVIEAVSMAGWACTLRGTPIWSDPKARIEVKTYDGQTLVRTPKTSPEARTLDGTTYETQTKQIAACAALFGSHEAWRRTSVFSSEDSTKFTRATDLERKALLESVLGLDKLDEAYAEATEAVQHARRTLGSAEHDVARAEGELAVVRARIDELKRLAQEQPIEVQSTQAAEAKRRALKQKRDELDDAIDAMNRDRGELDARLGEARKRARRLAMNVCPTCEQPIDAAARDRATREADQLAAEVERAQATSEAALARAQARRSETKDAIEQLTEAIDAAKAQAVARKAQEERLAALDEDARRYRKQALALADALEDCEDAVRTARLRLATLEAARKVLHPSGVRTLLMAQALETITSLANEWLSRLIGRELRIKLSPYTERVKGGVKESLALDVIGAGNGHGYAAASGGERRRIDLALLFALADLSAATSGRTGSTMWMDEVFDALDSDGIAAVVSALDDLAISRCVVVITHNEALRDQLSNRTSWWYVATRNEKHGSSLVRV